MKPPAALLAYYHRMTRRERVLSLIVAGTVFVLVNLLVLRFLLGTYRDLSEQSATAATDLKLEELWAKSQPTWEQRTRWLAEKQPVLTNRDRAPTQLLDQVQGAARANQVLISNPQLRALGGARGATTSNPSEYQAVSVHVETRSDWKQLVGFLSLLQKPENFIVFDLASVHTDPADPKLMRCSFDLSKWHAPAAK